MRCNISSKRCDRQLRRAHDDADRHGCVEEHSHGVFVGFVINLHNGTHCSSAALWPCLENRGGSAGRRRRVLEEYTEQCLMALLTCTIYVGRASVCASSSLPVAPNAAAADDDESDDDSEPLELESERVGETGDVGMKGTDPCQCRRPMAQPSNRRPNR